YPNGGVHQPGCPSLSISSCSHQRVHDLYIESIRPKDKTFKSWPCENYEKFQNGSCPNCYPPGCLDMGYHVSPNLEGDFFLTQTCSPFAKAYVQN
ncbi:Lipase member H, partial [Armadillidium nasatum]